MVPIILGLVPGPVLENRLRQAIGANGGDLSAVVQRPVSAVLLAVVALLIVGSLACRMKGKA